jgi:histidyl-tRNA synthetase
VALVGETEMGNGTISLKNMKTGEQQSLTLFQLINKITS